MPILEEIPDDQLPAILTDFYTETCKNVLKKVKHWSTRILHLNASVQHLTITSKPREVIADTCFIDAYEIFHRITRKGKKEGHGKTKSMPAIEKEDFAKLSHYFKEKMSGPPNAVVLQCIIVFNIIYYMARCGRETLHNMTKETFKIGTDHDGKHYIYQNMKKQDKNHSEDDFQPSNEARTYAIKGMFNFCKCPSLARTSPLLQ